MSANKARGIFLPRRGTRVSTIKSSQVVRNMVADTWRWLWPDTLMRVIPLAAIPFLYVAIFHLPQVFFYLVINGPVEELFFRGFLLAAVTQWTGWIGWGWLVSTATYTLYHRLGKWSWRSVGGVGLAGLVFSFLYLAQPEPRSLLAVVIVHGLTTWGFLSLGDEAMYRRWKRRQA